MAGSPVSCLIPRSKAAGACIVSRSSQRVRFIVAAAAVAVSCSIAGIAGSPFVSSSLRHPQLQHAWKHHRTMTTGRRPSEKTQRQAMMTQVSPDDDDDGKDFTHLLYTATVGTRVLVVDDTHAFKAKQKIKISTGRRAEEAYVESVTLNGIKLTENLKKDHQARTRVEVDLVTKTIYLDDYTVRALKDLPITTARDIIVGLEKVEASGEVINVPSAWVMGAMWGMLRDLSDNFDDPEQGEELLEGSVGVLLEENLFNEREKDNAAEEPKAKGGGMLSMR